jgi:HKD family nuclease
MEPCVNLLECIDKGLKEKVDRIKIAVAYVKLSGVEKFSSLLKNVSECTIVTSLDFGITELEGIKKLKELGCSVYLYNNRKEFHPKVYLFESESQKFAIVGSSNLSEGALTGKNVEFNLMISEKNLVDYVDSFINSLISESIQVDDNILSVLESGGYNSIKRESYDKSAWDILPKINENYYCEKFEELCKTIQESKKRSELKKQKFNIHKMALYKLICDLSSYGLNVNLNEDKTRGNAHAIIKAGNEVKVIVQGMVLDNQSAILRELDGFDYFVILRITNCETSEYYILNKNEMDKLIRENKITYNENFKYMISPKIYEKYESALDEFVRIIFESQ